MVGVIPSAKRCVRNVGFCFDQSPNYLHLAASKDCLAIDEYCSVPCGPPSSCELHTHLIEDKRGAVRSAGTERPSSLERPARRSAQRPPVYGTAGCSMHAARAPVEAATGLSGRGRPAAIET